MRAAKNHRGRLPSYSEGWAQFGSHDDDDGVNWLMFNRAQPNQDWLTIKIVANGKALRKANYWLTVNLVDGRIAFNRDQLHMRLYREGLAAKVNDAIQELVRQAQAGGRDAGGYRPVPGEPWPGARAGVRAPWPGETPLSYAEVEHGLREGVL